MFVVEVTEDDEVMCRPPGQPAQRISMSELGSVCVETNDSGPWGADVWWLLNNRAGETKVAFPHLSSGEDRVIERLKLLPGFEACGMNSIATARFLCWQSPVQA
ncbi:MAG: hypothetical protein ACK4P2_08970 [Hyphomonas sp.]